MVAAFFRASSERTRRTATSTADVAALLGCEPKHINSINAALLAKPRRGHGPPAFHCEMPPRCAPLHRPLVGGRGLHPFLAQRDHGVVHGQLA